MGINKKKSRTRPPKIYWHSYWAFELFIFGAFLFFTGFGFLLFANFEILKDLNFFGFHNTKLASFLLMLLGPVCFWLAIPLYYHRVWSDYPALGRIFILGVITLGLIITVILPLVDLH